MDGYKTIDELTADQFAELRNMMPVDIEGADFTPPDTWYDANGELTDEAVREYYKTTAFVDDDFCCTACDVVAETDTAAA